MKLQALNSRYLPLALGLLLLAVVIAAFFGRSLEKNIPALIPLIKYGFFVVLCAHATLLTGRLLRTTVRHSSTILRLILLQTAALAVIILVDFLLVEFAIETVHLVKYGLLAFFVFLWIAPEQGMASRAFLSAALRAFLAAALVGTVEECAQNFIPGRIFDRRDVFLNIASAFSGAVYSASSLAVLRYTQRTTLAIPSGSRVPAPAP